MRPSELVLLPSVSAPQVHPDGTWAVVAVSYPNLDADAYVGQLWRIDLSGGTAPRRLTRGFADSHPRFSADGSLLGFVRATPDDRPQVFVIPSAGGEPVQVTDGKLGVGAFSFSPDGRTIAYSARVPEEGRYGTLDGVGANQEDPRHIDTLKFQANGLGWTNDRRTQLFVVEVPDPYGEPPVKPVGRAAKALADAKAKREDDSAEPTAEESGLVPVPTQVTEGDYDHGVPVFTPDGAALISASARHDGRDTDLRALLHRFDLRGGDADERARRLTEEDAFDPCFAADGTLFCLGADLGESGRDFVGKQGGVYLVGEEGGRRLTDPDRYDVDPGLVAFAGGVLTTVNDRGTHRPLEVRADGTVTMWDSRDASIEGVAAIPGDTDRILVSLTTPDAPGEVGILSRDGSLEILTSFSAPLREAGRIAPPQELTATAADGYPVHGWVFLPEGEGPHPVLLNIHGGPHASYGPAFFDEFQTYVAAGYAVVACNPRGAAGYGYEHGRVIKGDMGNVDASDILAFLDHALATVDGLDADRVGVMGGSYGGYMTAWLIGHTDRFAAAIVERGYLDPHSFVGSSDIGWFFIEEYSGEIETWERQSPQAFADRVTTPTFVIHSEQDLRCPLGPALRYYTTLKLNGVDAELLVFPGENHELSRAGTPHHRLARFEAILGWWAKHLPVGSRG